MVNVLFPLTVYRLSIEGLDRCLGSEKCVKSLVRKQG
jgi:hypothetical protein